MEQRIMESLCGIQDKHFGRSERDQGELNCQQQGSKHPEPLCFISAQMDP